MRCSPLTSRALCCLQSFRRQPQQVGPMQMLGPAAACVLALAGLTFVLLAGVPMRAGQKRSYAAGPGGAPGIAAAA